MIIEEPSFGLKQTKTYPKLAEDIEADVAIIGAGIAGIFNAYILAKAGLKVVVLEKQEQILRGATVRTTAFLTKLIDSPFPELVKLYGEQKAKLIWQSGQDAIDLVVKVAKEHNVECELKFVPTRTYAKNQKEFEELSREYESITKSGFGVTLEKEGGRLNFRNSGFLEIPGEVMLHPMKFGQSLADLAESAGVKIFTNSPVLAFEGQTVKTKAGTVVAKDIVIATNQPLINEVTRFRKGMYITYVYELQMPKGLIPEGMYLDMGNPYHYFRVDSFEKFDRMIVGGEDHRLDFKISAEKNFRVLENYVRTVLDKSPYHITRKWSGHILESTDGLPFIGRINSHTFVITAFSGSGMTYAPISATIIRDLILQKNNQYIDLYAPSRPVSPRVVLTKAKDYIAEFFGGAFKNFFSR